MENEGCELMRNNQYQGLTDEEVQAKVAEGQVNQTSYSAQKTTAKIIKENVLTLFNALNFLLAFLLLLVGAYSNMAFIAIIILNITIGIVQEIRARDLVSKLTILSNKPVKVIRNGQEAIVPLGILLFLQAFFLRSDGVEVAVINSVAALIGMLPKGLVLLISLALSTAVLKLGKKNVLVQNMYAVEALAHMDMLCLDKTGAITQGQMSVEGIFPLNSTSDKGLLAKLANYTTASTATLAMLAVALVLPHFSDILTIQPMTASETLISVALLALAFAFWKMVNRYQDRFKAFFTRMNF